MRRQNESGPTARTATTGKRAQWRAFFIVGHAVVSLTSPSRSPRRQRRRYPAPVAGRSRIAGRRRVRRLVSLSFFTLSTPALSIFGIRQSEEDKVRRQDVIDPPLEGAAPSAPLFCRFPPAFHTSLSAPLPFARHGGASGRSRDACPSLLVSTGFSRPGCLTLGSAKGSMGVAQGVLSGWQASPAVDAPFREGAKHDRGQDPCRKARLHSSASGLSDMPV